MNIGEMSHNDLSIKTEKHPNYSSSNKLPLVPLQGNLKGSFLLGTIPLVAAVSHSWVPPLLWPLSVTLGYHPSVAAVTLGRVISGWYCHCEVF